MLLNPSTVTYAKSEFVQKSREKSLITICIICICTGIFFFMLCKDSLPHQLYMVALVVIFSLALTFTCYGKTNTAQFFILVSTTLLIAGMSIGFGNDLGVQHYLIISLVSTTVHQPRGYIKMISLAGIFITMVAIRIIQKHHQPYFDLPEFASYIYAFNVSLPYAITVLICWNLVNQAMDYQSVIEQQKSILLQEVQFNEKVLSIIGHDMRSPFVSTKGMLELLEHDLLDSKERSELHGQLKSSIDVSLQTLDNLLKWSSQKYLQQDQKSLFECLNIFELVENTKVFYRHHADEKNVTLENLIANDCYVWADAEQIAFVLRNLTNNALKFSFPGQKITFLAVSTNQVVKIQIKDEGTGIPEEIISKLFDITNRISTPGTIQEKGTGLGLLFCKEFIEYNKGKIAIESAPGKGTSVNFHLTKYIKP